MFHLEKQNRFQETAEAYVAAEKEKLAEVQAKLEGLEEVTCFIYDSTDEDDQIYTAFEGYTTNLLKLIGANNILSGKGVDKTWDYAGWETVLAENPQYIIICDYSTSIRNTDDFDAKVEKVRIKAFKDKLGFPDFYGGLQLVY